MALGRPAARFVALFPEVQLEAVADDRLVNLVDEHFDVALRINPSKDSALVGRRFARDRMVLAAAPFLHMPRGNGARPMFREGDRWAVNGGNLTIEPDPVLRLSSFLMVRDAIAAGAGVALIPESIIGSLVEEGI